MADSRYVVDLILNARDNTAAALAKASGELKALQAITKENQRQADELGRSFDAMSSKLNTSSAELKRQSDALTNSLRTQGKVTDDNVDKVTRLETASRNYARTISDTNSSEAQRVQALGRLKTAQQDLAKSLAESRNGWDKLDEAQRKQAVQEESRSAQRLANITTEIERQKALTAQYEQGARQRAAADAEAARARQEQERQGEAMSAEVEQNYQARHKARMSSMQDEMRRRQEMADLQRHLAEMDQRQEEENHSRRLANWQAQQAQMARMAEQRAQADETERRMDDAREARARAEETRWAGSISQARQYVQAIDDVAQKERARDAASRSGDTTETVKLDLDAREARTKAEALAGELKALLGHITANADFDSGEAEAHAVAFKEAMDALFAKNIKLNVDVDVDSTAAAKAEVLKRSLDDVGSSSSNAGGNMGFLKGLVGSLGEGFDQSSGRIASFDNFLRGLISLGFALFFQQLIMLAGAAAGALTALASSAMYAGAAMGGGLVAGIAEAIPIVGILATALYRLKAVFDAANQAQLLQQQQSYMGEKQNKKLADTTDAIKNAQDRLAQSHQAVNDAQTKLNITRTEAAQKLEDLIQKERQLRLGIEDTEGAMRRAAARGDTAALPGLELQRTQQNTELSRTTTEIQQRQTGPAPEVVQAQEALKNARTAADQAARAADKAGRAGDLASANITAAAGKLDFLLSRMSGAERHLFETVQKLQDVFRKTAETITQPIIVATDKAMQKLIVLLQDPKIIAAATHLSSAIASQLTRVFNVLTSSGFINQFLRITQQAEKNLKPITDIAINMGKAFMDVAEAAGPALHEILTWLDGISKKISEFFDAGRRSGALQSFFKEGVTQLKAWGDLLWQVVRLFAAIAGPGGGAQAGLGMVRSMANTIRGWADAISDTDSKASKFFRNFFALTRQVMSALTPIFTSLAHQFELTFNKQGVGAVKAFAMFISQVVIPGLGEFARWVAQITVRFAALAQAHPIVMRLGAALLATAASASVIGRAFTIFGPLIGPIRFLSTALLGMTGIMDKLMGPFRAFTAIAGMAGMSVGELGLAMAGAAAPFLAIGGVIVLLLAKLHLLDDLGRAVAGFFTAAWAQIKPPVDRLVKSFQNLFDALSKGSGVFNLLRPILKVLIDIAGYFLSGFGKAIGEVIGGLIDVISGFVNLVVDLLSGDFKGAWEAAKQIVVGIGRAIIGAVQVFLLDGLGKVFTKALEPIISFGGRFASLLFNAAKDGVAGFIRFLARLPGRVVGIIKDAIDGARHEGSGMVGFFGNLGERVFGAVKSGFSKVIDFFRDLPGTLWGFIKGVPGRLADVFTNVGPRVLKAIVAGFAAAASNIAGVGKDIVNSFIDLFNAALPNKIPVPGPLPDIPLPDNPIPHLAKGGPIKGGVPGRDSVLAMLMPGEHVLTAAEVARAGGHQAIFALRKALGGGGQSRGGRYADGGAAQGDGSGGPVAIQVEFTNNFKDFQASWRALWKDVLDVARMMTDAVQNQIRQMRVNAHTQMSTMYSQTRSSWSDMADSASKWTGDITDTVQKSMQRVKSATFDGMNYVATETNKALKGFGVKAVNIGIDPPNASRHAGGGFARFAGGGPVGQWGERGKDSVLAWLGRGEAVLNWGHQKVVNSALWQTYGTTLDGLFKRTTALHAGTADESPGFASGGRADGAGGSHYSRLMKAANDVSRRNFPYVWGGGHGMPDDPNHVNGYDCSGAVSYVVRAAGYNVPISVSGAMGNWPFPGGPGEVTVYYNDEHTFMKIGDRYWGTSGFARPNGGAGWFDQTPGADYLKGFKAIHLTNLGADAGGDGSVAAPKVSGSEPLKAMFTKIMGRVTSAANSYIQKHIPIDMMGQSLEGIANPTGGQLSIARTIEQVAQRFGASAKVLLAAIETGIVESGLRNLSYGDRDSLGVFQQRPSQGWGTPAEVTNVPHAAASFISRAMKIAGRYPNAGDLSQAVQGSAYPDRYNQAREQAIAVLKRIHAPSFAVGGEVPGHEGQAVPIIAHAREWVVNPRQQMRLAELMGTSVGKLRDLLGFRGGPKSFAGGGEVTPEQRRIRNIAKGNYDLPQVLPTDFSGLMDEMKRVFQAIHNISSRGKIGQQLNRFFSNIRALTDQDGLLDTMGNRIEAIGNRMQVGIDLAKVGLRRVGDRLVRRKNPMSDAVDIADATITMYEKIGDRLRGERTIARRGLDQTNARLATLRHGGITKNEQDQYTELMAARQKFHDTLDDIDSKYAENRQNIYDQQTARFQAVTDRRMRRSTIQMNLADTIGKVGSALGRDDLTQQAGAMQLDALQKQQKILGDRVKSAMAKAKNDPRWQTVADDLYKQYLDTSASVVQQVHDNIAAGLDSINKGFDRQQAAIDIWRRIATATGNTDALRNLATATIDAQKNQIAQLALAMDAAQKSGDVGLTQQIGDQMADLQAKVVEETSQMFDDAVSAMEKGYDRRQTALDLRQKAADLQTRMGDRLGGLRTSQGVETDRIATLTSKLADYNALLTQATAPGSIVNADTVADLRDKIADLGEQINEENETRKELVWTYRQTAMDIITGAQNRTTGLIGTANDIYSKLDAIAGISNQGDTLRFLQQIGQTLTAAAQQIGQNVADAISNSEFGQQGDSVLSQLVAAFQDSPGTFANKLAELAPTIAALESTMSDTEKSAFDALIQAMIDNTSASVDNTQAVQTATGALTNPQGWATSAWQWYREAIFNGMGEVLPQYDIPQMASGGFVTKDGLFKLHAGEFVVNQRGDNVPKEGDINITMHAVDGEVDMTALAARIAFEKKSR